MRSRLLEQKIVRPYKRSMICGAALMLICFLPFIWDSLAWGMFGAGLSLMIIQGGHLRRSRQGFKDASMTEDEDPGMLVLKMEDQVELRVPLDHERLSLI